MSFLIFLFSIHCFAAQEAIDLGELEVKGDVRKPSVHFYQLKSMHEKQLEEFSELNFDQFENYLLNLNEAKNETR